MEFGLRHPEIFPKMSFGAYTATYDHLWAPGDPDHLGPKGIRTADGEDAWKVYSLVGYVLEHPDRDIPFLVCISGTGKDGGHTSEFGWQDDPRGWAALQRARQPFVACWSGGGDPYGFGRLLGGIRWDATVPAFSRCSLDNNPGNGDPGDGDFYGQLNGYLAWDGAGASDEPGRWEMTAWIVEGCPRDRCVVDVTPRHCRRFRPRPGDRFAWTVGPEGGPAMASGEVAADRWGLVTIEGAPLSRERRRLAIRGTADAPAGTKGPGGPQRRDPGEAAPEGSVRRGEAPAVNLPEGPGNDGRWNDRIWELCPPWPLGPCGSEAPQALRSWARVLFDGSRVHVRVRCEEPDTAALAAKAGRRDGPVWEDDSVEVFLRPDPREPACQVVVNPAGAIYDARGKDPAWDSGAVARASVEDGRSWTATLTIPIRSLGAAAGPGQTWSMNICRTRPPRGGAGTLQSSWSLLPSCDYHETGEFGIVTGIDVAAGAGTRSRRPLPPPERGVESGGVTVYGRFGFDSGLDGWEGSNGATVSLSGGVTGGGLEVACEGSWAGARRPIAVSGSRGLRLAYHMRARGLAEVGLNIHDALTGDNTTPLAPRFLQEGEWTPVLYLLDRCRYNSQVESLVAPAALYDGLLLHGPEARRPGAGFAVDGIVLYRGEDRSPPSAPGGLRAEAGPGGARLSWLPAADNVGILAYAVSRSDGGGPFRKVAETARPEWEDPEGGRGLRSYRVLAVDFEENLGPWCGAVDVDAGEGPPAALDGAAPGRPPWADHVGEVHRRGDGKVRRGRAALFGDSLTGATSYRNTTEAALGNLDVAAHGFPSMRTDFGRGAAAGILDRENPEYLLVLFGTNNGKGTEEIPRAMEDLEAIVRAGEERGTVVLLGTIPPRGWSPGSEPEVRYNRAVLDLAARLRIPAARIFEGITAAGDRRRFIAGDGVHWTGEGMAVAGRAWGKAMAEVRFVLRDRD